MQHVSNLGGQEEDEGYRELSVFLLNSSINLQLLKQRLVIYRKRRHSSKTSVYLGRKSWNYIYFPNTKDSYFCQIKRYLILNQKNVFHKSDPYYLTACSRE